MEVLKVDDLASVNKDHDIFKNILMQDDVRGPEVQQFENRHSFLCLPFEKGIMEL